MADVIPGQKTEVSARDVIEVTPWCAAYVEQEGLHYGDLVYI